MEARQMISYLIDSNVFVQAKEREYRFDFAEAFWDWLLAAHTGGLVFSVQKVLAELNLGKPSCPARQWAAGVPSGFFLPDAGDKIAMNHYAALMKWAWSNNQYSNKAKEDFADLDDADAFLISVAKRNGMIVCTHEDSSPMSKNSIKLPDAASAIGVKTIKIYDLLSLHATSPSFTFRP
jgi:Domain of unknown function (DUF4411)